MTTDFDRTHPRPPKTLILAAREHSARDTATEHGIAWRDVIYVSSPTTIRGLSTGGSPRLLASDFRTRRDADEILEALAFTDLFPAPDVTHAEPTA